MGINPEKRFFVGVDPALHSPTRFFISIEFKEENASQIMSEGWASWERQKRDKNRLEEPVEIVVGGAPEQFLNYVRFERAAKGLDQGHRGLLADKLIDLTRPSLAVSGEVAAPPPLETDLHRLALELKLSESEILDLIQSAPRLKMAVRGWVAEEHLYKALSAVPSITACERIEEEGQPDIRLRLGTSRHLTIECKNVCRKTYADGTPKVDFQRTRAAKDNACSRYYQPDEFDLVAACLHAKTEEWEFTYVLPQDLKPHRKCDGRLDNNVRVDNKWSPDIVPALRRALDLRA